MKRITFQCDYEISDMSEEQHRETMTLRIHNTVVRESKLMLESPTFLLSHSRSTSTLTNLSSSDVHSYMGAEYESFGNSYHSNSNTPTNASNSAHNSNTVTSATAVAAALNHNVHHSLEDVNSSIVATGGSTPTTELPIHQVTGCIFSLSFPSLFVSLEGSCAIIDHLFEVFTKDEFMKNILCLRVKFPIRNRFYSEYVLTIHTVPYFRSHSSSTYTAHSPHSTPFLAIIILFSLSISPTLANDKIFKDVLFSTSLFAKYSNTDFLISQMQTSRDPVNSVFTKHNRVIMYCNIVSYSTLLDLLSPTIIFQLLNTYNNLVESVVKKHGGTLSKFNGENVLCYFNVENKGVNNAVAAAVGLIQSLDELKAKLGPDNPRDPLRILYSSVSLSTGGVIEGSCGSKSRRDHIISGDAVHIASRLENEAVDCNYFVMFDENVAHQVTADSPYYSKMISAGESHMICGRPVHLFTIYSTKRPTNLEESIASFLDSSDEPVNLALSPSWRARSMRFKHSVSSSFDMSSGMDLFGSSPTLALLQTKTEECEALKKELAILREWKERYDLKKKNRKGVMNFFKPGRKSSPRSPTQASGSDSNLHASKNEPKLQHKQDRSYSTSAVPASYSKLQSTNKL